MKYLVLIFGVLLGLICVGYLIYKIVTFVKVKNPNEKEIKISKNFRLLITILILIQGIFTICSSYGLVIAKSMNLKVYEHFLLIFGSYFMGTGFDALLSSFIIYYYKPDLDVKQRRFARISTFISIPIFVLGIYLLTQGIADYLIYPLHNAFSIPGGILRPFEGSAGLTITFYALVILTGAIIVYYICDHYFYKVYKQHGMLETLLLCAFIPGIIGARLWFCLVLETKYFVQHPGEIIQIWNGGLAIQGGVIFGALCGILYMVVFKKHVNIRFAMDVIIPTILIAQAVGRFGNFFNLEVHGNEVLAANWQWLPKIILNNMSYTLNNSGKLVMASSGYIYLPLFFIESLTNLTGYFLIRYGVGKGLRKWISLGDLSMSYLIWYGLTRFLLEPLREGYTTIVGSSSAFGYAQSYITAIVMISVGVLGIIGFHLYDYIRKRKGLEPRNWSTL